MPDFELRVSAGRGADALDPAGQGERGRGLHTHCRHTATGLITSGYGAMRSINVQWPESPLGYGADGGGL